MIPVNEPALSGNEKKYLLECIDSGWISSEGPFVKKFEAAFAEKVDRQHGIAVTNGTVALEAAVAALDIGPGDEVIVPTFSIISCCLAVIRNGATPVLLESDLETWNIDPADIEAKISEKTKAIMVVHTYGLPVDMDPVLEIARKHGLKVIEDAAEMHGQLYKGKPCGSFGDISTFSFYPNKHITTGEGGMIVTNDAELAETCRSLRNLCFQPQQRFIHERLGWNLRMTNLQAAVGLAQLEQLDKFVARKREIGLRYRSHLEGHAAFSLPPHKTNYAENIYWVFGLLLAEETDLTAKDVMAALKEHKIGTRPFFWPMHEQPVFQKMNLFQGEWYPKAEFMARKGFYLPSGLGITNNQIDEVANRLLDYLG